MPLIALAFAATALLRRFRLWLFGSAWLVLSFAALVAIYWVSRNPVADNLFNSSDRTIDSLMLTGALLVPVILAPDEPPGGATGPTARAPVPTPSANPS